jgi:single-strand DNA-binding protein
MAHINVTLLGGNLTRDPEVRYAASGTAIAQFTIAVNRKWKTETGEQKEEVSFIDCVAFGRTAENIAQYFHKGEAILVQGRLKQDRWDDKSTGKPRSKIQVSVDTFHFVTVREKGADEGPYIPAAKRTPPVGKPAETAAAGFDGDPADSADDDVPF